MHFDGHKIRINGIVYVHFLLGIVIAFDISSPLFFLLPSIFVYSSVFVKRKTPNYRKMYKKKNPNVDNTSNLDWELTEIPNENSLHGSEFHGMPSFRTILLSF